MVKKIGDINFKIRSDKGKKRPKYKGKPTRYFNSNIKKKFKYKSQREPGDPIKIWYRELIPISKESMMLFSKKTRPFMKRIAHHPSIRIDLDQSRICNKEVVEDTTLEIMGYPGTFQMLGFGHNKNKFHVSPFKLCQLEITENENGECKCRMTKNFRLWRYSWWEGGGRKKQNINF